MAHDLGQWLHAQFCGRLCGSHHKGGCAIADLTGVASGDRALRIKGRTKFGEAFGRRIGPHAFVHPNSTFGSWNFSVPHFRTRKDPRFGVEMTGRSGCCGFLVRPCCEGVLIFA